VDPGDVNAHSSFATAQLDPNSPCDQSFWSPKQAPSGKSTRLSNKYYLRSSLATQHRGWEKGRCATRPEFRNAMRALADCGTWRTHDPEALLAMAQCLEQHAEVMRAEMVDDKQRALNRMLRWRRKRSCLDQAAARLLAPALAARPELISVGLGNGKWRSHGPSAPKKELWRALKRKLKDLVLNRTGVVRAVLVSVDEFRTTMLCSVCHHVMAERTKRRPGDGKVISDRDFRDCTHCGTEAAPKARNRDGDAGKSILFKLHVFLKGEELPENYRRGHALKKG